MLSSPRLPSCWKLPNYLHVFECICMKGMVCMYIYIGMYNLVPSLVSEYMNCNANITSAVF